MNDVKPLLILFMSFAGVIFYMAVAHDTSPGAWTLVGVLAAAVVVASLIGLKRYPEMLLRVATFTALALSIFAGVTWYYTRSQDSGRILAATSPIALGLAIGSLAFSRRRKSGGDPRV